MTATRMTPTWVDGLTWYHVHSLAALGAPAQAPAGGGGPGDQAPPRLAAMHGIVDHAADLGLGGLLLTPVFASLTHGYDTIDPFRVDPRLGSESDLLAVVEHAHHRGMRVLLDGVLNHVGRAFPRFERLLEGDRDQSVTSWFRLHEDSAAPDGFAYDVFEGHRALPELNHANPAVLDWAVEVACYWLERGIDGWRLDAAYAVPTDFWRSWSDRVKARFPDALLLAEVIHGDYGAFAVASGIHSITQYELYKATWSSLNDGNLFELGHALDRHVALIATQPGGVVPLTFVGNHDVTRILSRLDDPAVLGHALAVLFTVPGTPAVYYGDELGFTGVKEQREGGDDAIRPVLPVPVPQPSPEQAGVLELYRSLIALRRERPWLTTATATVVELANLRARVVVSAPGHALTTVLNLDTQPMPLGGDVARWRPVAGDGAGRDSISSVSGRSWAVLEQP
jgi:cyclomaltodextrinase